MHLSADCFYRLWTSSSSSSDMWASLCSSSSSCTSSSLLLQLCRTCVSLHVLLLFLTCVDASSNGNLRDCISSSGVGYRGEQQASSSGLTCLNWINTSRDYDVNMYPDSLTGVGDHSYCRNPDSSEMPWCYISGPDGSIQRQFCSIISCTEESSTVAASSSSSTTSAAPVKSRVPGEAAAGQPVMGISQRVRTGPKKKKDLGTMGYVLGILMMAVIILLGVGITVGYFYKRGRDLQQQRSQRVYERELQRITLPLSAFSNPGCELVDENTIVITAEGDHPGPVRVPEDPEGGGDPLMGQQQQQQAGTPGA